ncbi:MAG: hypothetical protein MO847_06165 [Candidatus Protistobacter heckmanni]|nr:hypothetical protein [Candidatus Protistobacter heckmanni]
MADQTRPADVVRAYFDALNLGADVDELSAFYCRSAEPVQFPSQVFDPELERDPDNMLDAAIIGRKLVVVQKYTILKVFEAGADAVIVEAKWEGALALPIGELSEDDVIHAHFAAVFEFEGGKIAEQRNYDAFDPFRIAVRRGA